MRPRVLMWGTSIRKEICASKAHGGGAARLCYMRVTGAYASDGQHMRKRDQCMAVRWFHCLQLATDDTLFKSQVRVSCLPYGRLDMDRSSYLWPLQNPTTPHFSIK